MAQRFGAKVLYPGKLMDIPRARAGILNALKAAEKETRQLYCLTFATWKHKPELQNSIIRYAGGDPRYWVGIRDNGDKNSPESIWHYLDEGTAIRYAIMSKNFVPKTMPNALSSHAGKGGKAGMIRKGSRPHNNGIKARNWTLLIERHVADTIVPRLKYAVDAEIVRAML